MELKLKLKSALMVIAVFVGLVVFMEGLVTAYDKEASYGMCQNEVESCITRDCMRLGSNCSDRYYREDIVKECKALQNNQCESFAESYVD